MKGMTIAAFVMGIVGIVFGILSGWFSVIGLPISIVALVLAAISGKQLKEAGEKSGLSTAALVLSIIATVFTAIGFFTCGLCVICAVALS